MEHGGWRESERDVTWTLIIRRFSCIFVSRSAEGGSVPLGDGAVGGARSDGLYPTADCHRRLSVSDFVQAREELVARERNRGAAISRVVGEALPAEVFK